jgi:hypothetical protein
MRRAAPALLVIPLAVILLVPALLAGPLAPPLPRDPSPHAQAASIPPHDGAAPFTTLVCPFALPNLNVARPLEQCNVRATAHTGPASEMSIAMDPADPLHLVATAKDYNYTRLLPPNGIESTFSILGPLIVYATTFDGGLTWTEGYLENLTDPLVTLPLLGPVGNTNVHESDPVAVFGPDGQPLILTLPYASPSEPGLILFHSDDGGLTFEARSRPYNGNTDKQWIAVADGNIYVVTLHSSGTGFVRSTDGGFTWSAPRKILNAVYPWIDTGPNGEIYVTAFTGSQFLFTRSLDQGATWSPASSLAHINGVGIGGQLFRTPQFGYLQASKADAGVYVVWHDVVPSTGEGFLANDDIFLAQSHNSGLTWSAPVRINDDPLPTAFQFQATLAVSPNGQDVHVAWLDQRNDPTGQLVEAYYAHSPDAGATWEPNIKLSDLPYLADLGHHQAPVPGVGGGIFLGDYMGLAASDDRAVIAFPDTRYGRPDIFVATVV